MKNLGCILRVDNVLRPGTFNNFKKIMRVINSNEITSVINVTPKWHGENNHNLHHSFFI